MRRFLLAGFLVLCGCETSLDWSFGKEEVLEEGIAARRPSEIETASLAADWQTLDPENTLYIDIPQGRVVVALSPDLAPRHVAQVKQLAREGFYDGLSFYRVVAGFVAQGGDESETREIKTAAKTMQAEFEEPWQTGFRYTPLGNPDGYADEVGFLNGFPVGRDLQDQTTWLAHCAGAFAFGRNNERDSASTEFYITLQPQRYLDRNLTVFGRVIWGMEHVQAMLRGSPGNGGVIEDKERWTVINSFKVAADLPVKEQLTLQVFDTGSLLFSELIAARTNRPEEFFYFRPGHVDLCQMPIPVRLEPGAEQ